MAARKTGLLLDPVYRKHDPGGGHPESVERYRAITRRLEEDGLTGRTVRLQPRKATETELLRCHEAGYLATARKEIEAGARQLSTGDTAVCPQSHAVALEAAGGTLAAVDAVCGSERRIDHAFCAVRPPGHHATADRGMGFCIFNNAALAARHAREAHGIERVLIVDWDVHHGNGTQDIFYEDGTVFFFSTHQHPWYPGTGKASETGAGDGKDTTLNVPLPAGSGMKEIGGAFRERLVPAMENFRPGLVIVSAGFDSRVDDPLGQFRLTDGDFVALTKILLDIAAKHGEGRLVSVLEGGYNTEGLAKAAAAHLGALIGHEQE